MKQLKDDENSVLQERIYCLSDDLMIPKIQRKYLIHYRVESILEKPGRKASKYDNFGKKIEENTFETNSSLLNAKGHAPTPDDDQGGEEEDSSSKDQEMDTIMEEDKRFNASSILASLQKPKSPKATEKRTVGKRRKRKKSESEQKYEVNGL